MITRKIAVALIAAAGLLSGAVACTSQAERPSSQPAERKPTDVKAFTDFAVKGEYAEAVRHVAEIRTSDGDVKIITDLRSAGEREKATADSIAAAYLDYRGKKGMWNEIAVTNDDGTELIVLPAGD